METKNKKYPNNATKETVAEELVVAYLPHYKELSLDFNRRYTYADYLTWTDNKMRELFNGFINMMSPAPTSYHQEISGNLFGELRHIIKKNKKGYKIFHAPFDVRLPQNGEREDDKIYTVVQPDICVVCDLSKIDKRGCLGAPDLVVEVLSFATVKYDLNEKFNLYEVAGVREYWVIFPLEKTVQIFLLQSDGWYDKGTLYEAGKIPVSVFNGEEVDMNDIF